MNKAVDSAVAEHLKVIESLMLG